MDMKAVFIKPSEASVTFLEMGTVWGNLRDGDSYRVGEDWYDATDRFHNYEVDELMQSTEFRLRVGQKMLFMTSGELNLGAGKITSIRMVDRTQLDLMERPGVEYIVSLWDVLSKRKQYSWAWLIEFTYM